MAISTEWKDYAAELSKEYTDALNAKNTIGIIKKTSTQALKVAINPEDYNQVIKDLTKAALELIPYGGIFLSTIVDLAWPKAVNSTKTMLDSLRKELTELIDEKIGTQYVSDLNKDYELIDSSIVTLEHLINDTNNTSVAFETRRTQALTLNKQFQTIIKYAGDETHKVIALPQYTTAIISYITFLIYMHKNGKKMFDYPYDVLEANYNVNEIRELIKECSAHIYKTFMQGSSTFREKQQEIEKRHKSDSSTNPWDNLNSLKQRKATIDDRLDAIKPTPGIPFDPHASERLKLQHELGLLSKDIPIYEKLIKANDDFYNTTWGFLALQELMKEYHLELKDLTKSGLHTDPKNGQTYYYDDKGNMLTGWHEINNKWSYFSPINNNSNYEHTKDLPHGATFNKGQRMYGWIKVIGDTDYNYYISPLDNNTNAWQPNHRTFNTGEMWIGWLQWTGIAGTHWYFLYTKHNSVALNKPEGHLAHGCVFTIEGRSPGYGERFDKFDESGKWIGKC